MITDPHRAALLALGRLVSECDEVRQHLERLSEEQLPAWVHNLWHEALAEARAVQQSDGTVTEEN